MSRAEGHDVVIVGAGPAGSTAAALLAQAGHRVLVLEKDDFPRFHIGESLLPVCLPVLERLGVEPSADTFVFKRGAEFLCETSGRQRRFDFRDTMPGCPDYSWQVERSTFDLALRDRARACGAEVRHGEAVSAVDIDAEGVRVRTGSGTVRARFVIDASGQDRLLARQQGTIERYPDFGAVSVFTHFGAVDDAVFEEFAPGNEVRILQRPEGWGWILPLPDRRLSIGIVSKRRLTPDALDEGLLAGPLATRWTAGAERLATHVARNFSCCNTVPSGPRFAAVGDAACFLDPVFSSGVALAMRGAEALADLLGPALAQGREAAPDLLDGMPLDMGRAYRTFEVLIDRFYNSRLGDSVFLGNTEGMPMYQGVMSVLAGDVWRHDNPFQELLLRPGRRRRRVR